jgi:hypothetical protein
VNERGGNAQTARPLTRELVLFFLRLLGVSALLYALYYIIAGRWYVRFIALLADPMLRAFGYRIVMEKALKITEDIALNPLVFLSFVVAVGRIAWRTKLRAAAIGVVILTLVNALTVFMIFMSNYRRSDADWEVTEFLGLTINFFLPIVLWFVLLPIRQAFPFFTLKKS